MNTRKTLVKKPKAQLKQESSSLPVKLSLGERIQQLHIKGLVSIQEPRTPVRVFHEKYEGSPASNGGSPLCLQKSEEFSPKKGDNTTRKANGLDSFPNSSQESTPTIGKCNSTSVKRKNYLNSLKLKDITLSKVGSSQNQKSRRTLKYKLCF